MGRAGVVWAGLAAWGAMCVSAPARGAEAESAPAGQAVSLMILVEHDPWTVACPDDESFQPIRGHGFPRGYRSLRHALPAGRTYRLSGQMGWSVDLRVAADGTCRLSEPKAGPYLAAPPRCFVSKDKALEAVFGPVAEFRLRIPADYGAWEIPGAYGARPGYRRVELPDGRWTVKGRDWEIPLRVEKGALSPGGAAAGLPAEAVRFDERGLELSHREDGLAPPAEAGPAPRAFATTRDARRGLLLEPLLASPADVAGASIEVPEGAFVGVGAAGERVLAAVAVPVEGGLDVEVRALRGRLDGWSLAASLAPMDRSCPLAPVAVAAKLGQAVRVPLPDAPSGAYLLSVAARPGDGGAGVEVHDVVFVSAAPAVSLWLPAGREAYASDEPIELCVWQQRPEALELVALREGLPAVALGEVRGGLVRIAADSFAPGEVTLALRAGGKVLARRAVTVLDPQRPTNFVISAYASILDSPADVDKLDALGVKGFYEQRGVELGLRGRLDELTEALAAWRGRFPAVGPAERYAPPAGGFLEHLDRKGWRLFAQWGSWHQPYGHGITTTDPVVIERVAATSAWAAMAGRQHPCFLGMNLFDECGTPRGPRMSDDGSYLEYEAFRKRFGRPRPAFFGEDDEAAREWVFDKQHQLHAVYAGTRRVLDEMNRLADPGSWLYLGTQNGNLNSMAVDGGHPPLSYRAISLSPMHYYPVFWRSCVLLGNEWHFMLPEAGRVEYRPLIDANGHLSTTRHEASLVVSRQADGIAYFHWNSQAAWSFMPKEYQSYFEGAADPAVRAHGDGLKQLNDTFTRWGDFLRTIRRDRRAEVAVLHSLYDFAHELLPTRAYPMHAYLQAYHHAFKGYLAIAALLKAGVQAGWLSEEELLERDGLDGRKAVVLLDVEAMRPEVRRRLEAFARDGGAVFADAATTVRLEGARPLPVNFGEMTELCKRLDARVMPQVVPVIERHVLPLFDRAVRGEALGDLLVTRQVNGQAEYWLVVAERLAETDEKTSLALHSKDVNLYRAVETAVTVPATGVVYDALAGRMVTRAAAAAKVDLKLPPGGLAVLAVLPEPVGSLRIEAPASASAGTPAPLRVELRGESGRLLRAAVPLEVQVIDRQGRPARAPLYRSTDDGVWTGAFRPGLFDPAAVQIVVRELLTGKTASADVRLTGAAGRLERAGEGVLAENAAALGPFFRDLREAYVVLGDSAPDASAVAPLVDVLRAAGVDVVVRRAGQLAVKGFDVHVGRGLYRTTSPIHHHAADAFEVDRAVIAVGAPADHALLRQALWGRRWTRRLAAGGLPAPAGAYVCFLWRPFSLADDGVLAVAEDPAGVVAAVEYLARRAKETLRAAR